MPIEIQIEKQHGKNLPAEKTQACAAPMPPSRSSARRRISCASACSATGTIPTRRWPSGTRPTRSASLGKILQKGYVYRGLKPVNWCFDCGSALAEAEVEYADRKDFAIDVGFPFAEPDKIAKAFGLAKLPDGPGLHRHLDHHAVDHPGEPGAQRASGLRLQPGADRARPADPRRGPAGDLPRALRAGRTQCAWRVQGHGARAHHVSAPVLRPPGAGLSGRVRDARYRHRHRAQRAGLRRRGLHVLPPLRHEGRGDPHAGDGRRQLRGLAAVLRRHDDLEGQSRDRQEDRGSGRAVPLRRTTTHSYMHCWRHKTPIIYRATRSGSPAWTRCRAARA